MKKPAAAKAAPKKTKPKAAATPAGEATPVRKPKRKISPAARLKRIGSDLNALAKLLPEQPKPKKPKA